MNVELTCFLCTYNRCEYLKKQLESILNQTYRDFKLVVLDNASNDGTEAILSSYDDSRLVYIRHNENIGGLNNIKYAFDNCDTKYMIVLHDDDCCDSRLFERELKAIKEGKYTLVSANAVLIDENDKVLSKSIKSFNSPIIYEGNDYLREYFIGRGSLIFPTVMYDNHFLKEKHLSITIDAGPCGDVVLLADIFAEGGRGLELPETLLYYRHHNMQDSALNMVSMHIQLYNYMTSSKRFNEALDGLALYKNSILGKLIKRQIVWQCTKGVSFQETKETIISIGKLLSLRKLLVNNILFFLAIIQLFNVPLGFVLKHYIKYRTK